jgi:uncharacterized protein (DUF736 family)
MGEGVPDKGFGQHQENFDMNIGTLKANAEGVHIGRITTLTFSATVALRAFESTNERAPKFDLMALSADRRSWVKIGALWEYSSNETGECFLSGQIDDPSLSAPIPVAMFQQNDGSFNVAWRRSKPKASLDGFGSESEGALPPLTATGDEPASDRGVDSGAPSGDGLGESTAPKPAARTKARESVDA